MTEVDFSNAASVRAWLETQSIEKRCVMCSRVALRVLAGIGQARGDLQDRLALAVFRAVLATAVLGVGRQEGRSELESAAQFAAVALDSDDVRWAAGRASNVEHSTASSADSSAMGLIASSRSYSTVVDAANAAWDLDAAARCLTFVHGRIIDAAEADAQNQSSMLLQMAVWDQTEERISQDRDHVELLTFLDSHSDWTFFRRWYAQMWDGTFRDWDLAIEVATLPPALWEGEDALAKVAEAIRGLRRVGGHKCLFLWCAMPTIQHFNWTPKNRSPRNCCNTLESALAVR
ncbi:hypothetical protein ACERZ8_02695 [Tateyamaria armeniaca]|uniref:Uncharacterized protein n=1 Tax=Tateyamaria armeniaca TaxID=2518930 RepID=A0ABW8UNY3_9RHOB